LIDFNDFLYVQVSITLHYFLFELGFIQIFLCNIPSISGIWYLGFVYVKLNIFAFSFPIIHKHLWKYLVIFLFSLYFFTLIPSLSHLALLLTDTTLLDHCMPDYPRFGNLDRGSVDFLKTLVAVR
jgi:hypothetical protein